MDEDFKLMLRFVKNLLISSKLKDIKKIQEKIGKVEDRIIAFHLTGIKGKTRSFYFQIKDSKLNWFPTNPGRTDLNLFTTTTTMLNIIDGRKKVLNHKTNTLELAPYSPLDAFRMQDIYGDDTLNITDVKVFIEIFNIEIEEFRKITGPIRSKKY